MKFSSNKVSDIQRVISNELQSVYPPEEIRSITYIILKAYAGLTKVQVLADPQRSLSESELLKVHDALKELKKNKPIQYVIGKASFCGLEIIVNEAVLIPRQETEELLAWILEDCSGADIESGILDIGTGSGCIALALKQTLPEAEVIAADISLPALEIAKMNARSLNLELIFRQFDVLDEDQWPERPFDIIVSNPPYVRQSDKRLMAGNILEWEPPMALFVPDEDPLLYYRSICRFAFLTLNQNACVYLEINEALAGETQKLAMDSGLTDAAIRKDINGKYRMLRARKV